MDAVMPINNLLTVYKKIQKYDVDVLDAIINRIDQLIELDEPKRQAQVVNMRKQQQVCAWQEGMCQKVWGWWSNIDAKCKVSR